MRASVIAKAVKRAALASLAAPALIACGSSPDAAASGQGSTGSVLGSSECADKSSDAGVGVDPPCIRSFELAGLASACNPDDAGELTKAQCDELCAPGAPVSCAVYEEETTSYVSCYYGACNVGRRPEGLSSGGFRGTCATGRFLAEAAFLEAASIDAFERLIRELRAHRAPRHLCVASRRAARDEVRHARMTRCLAERAGGCVPRYRVGLGRVRAIEQMAIENAVEGCVRETFGAAIAIIQAERANDRHVRRAMRAIAPDEMRHAQLSWAIAGWLDTKLDRQARGRVRRARAKAVDALVRSVAVEPDPDMRKALGLPTAAQARVVLEQLRASLWWCSAARRMLGRRAVDGSPSWLTGHRTRGAALAASLRRKRCRSRRRLRCVRLRTWSRRR